MRRKAVVTDMPGQFVPLLATYAIHSTCLLSGVWLVFWLKPPRAVWLRQAVWKLAMLLGFVTAPLQTMCGLSFWKADIDLAAIASRGDSGQAATAMPRHPVRPG